MNPEVEDSFAAEHTFLHQRMELLQMMMEDTVSKFGYNDPQTSVETVQDLSRGLEKYKHLEKSLQELEIQLDELEREYFSDISEETAKSTTGLRRFIVELTQGMINQRMITLTVPKRRGTIREHEKFHITMPDGEKISTELAQPGNRLRERGAFAKLYEAENLQPGAQIFFKETHPGHWNLRFTKAPLDLI